jgi:aryl-alcohol dehydrogenase
MQIDAAFVMERGGPFQLRGAELEAPKGNEIRVKIAATGICHTDVIIRDQFYPTPLPAVLGHEGAGVVESVGPDVRTIKSGDHVLLSFASCGTCPSCQGGKTSYCWHHMEMNFSGRRYSGTNWDVPSPIKFGNMPVSGAFFHQSSFATHAIATEANAVVIDKSLPLRMLAPLGCGIQTGAGAILNTLQPKPGASVAITGTGSVGLSAVMAAAIAQCGTIIAIDMNAERLKLAKELGATHTVNPADGDVVEQVKAISPSGVQFALETTGNPKVLRSAFDILQVRGICGLIGGAKLGTEVSIDMTHLLFGRTVRGILQGDSNPKEFIPQLIEHYQAGRFPVDKLITHYSFADINIAIADMKSGKTIKPVLEMFQRRAG